MINYSIIIPHKNSSVLLERLVKTIPQQTDVEVLIIDDHSTPDEVEQVKKIAQQYGAVWAPNQGNYAGGARNTGLRLAHGRWLVFADADDLFLPSLAQMMKRYETADADVVVFDANSCFSDTMQPAYRAEHINSLFAQYAKDGNTRAVACRQLAPWGKFVKRELVEQHHITYEEVIAANDLAFNVRVACLAQHIVADNTPIYTITATSGSITNTLSEERMESRLQSVLRANKVLRDHGYSRYQMSVLSYIATGFRLGWRYEAHVLWTLLRNGANPFIGGSKLFRARHEWQTRNDQRVQVDSRKQTPTKLLVNGIFYGQMATGTHRFARELMSELDKIVDDNLITIAVPRGVDTPKFQHLRVVQVGHLQDILWEQISLPIYAYCHRSTLISLTNTQPLLHPGIMCIHDAAYKTHPEYFPTLHGRLSALWHRIIFAEACRMTHYPLLTVSEFSRGVIANTYHISPERLTVISNGWQHLVQTQPDFSVFEQYNLQRGQYYFTLGNVNINKNTRWVIEYAQKHPNDTFVLSGPKRRNSEVDIEADNVHYLGYVSDQQMAALYAGCKAFIFPSLHEGFGIPPMEALSRGARAIVANTTCLPEIYRDSVYYIDPYDTTVDLDEILSGTVAPAQDVLDRYSWSLSAKKLHTLLLCQKQ